MAHQPRVVNKVVTDVPEPEISKAYYGKLMGAPQVFRIASDKPFHLYVNVLVPDIVGQKQDVSAVIVKDNDNAHPLAMLDASTFQWKIFFEPFGHDTYWMGPEYRSDVGPGTYRVSVYSPNNDSRYSLAIGETESFGFTETANAIKLIPELKRDFFDESPANFVLSPFGFGYILIVYALAFIMVFASRLILKKFGNTPARRQVRNIGNPARWLRALAGTALLAWAVATTWGLVIILLSGFVIFESLFSWSLFYAIVGRDFRPTG